MTDSFNPHEILSRLRAKPNIISNGTNANTSISSIPSTPNSSNVNNNAVSNNKATSKLIKTPVPLTLTPQQRQDNLTVRNELEKEIKKLQDEISALKVENKQLKLDKEDVEKQFIDFKAKSDDTVTKLRGKIAALTNQKGQCEGTGKVYPPPPPSSVQGVKMQHIMKTPNLPNSGPRNQVANGKITNITHNNLSNLNAAESFREPTFSELMRRSTAEQPDFKESLRKIPTNTQNFNNQSQLSFNNYPFENAAFNGNMSKTGGNNEAFLMSYDLKSPTPNFSNHNFQGSNRSNSLGNPMFIDHTPPAINTTASSGSSYYPSEFYPNASIGNPKIHVNGNMYYNNSNNGNNSGGGNNNIFHDVMIPGRDDNLVIIPTRKGSVPNIGSSSSVISVEGGGGNGFDIPVVEIDLS